MERRELRFPYGVLEKFARFDPNDGEFDAVTSLFEELLDHPKKGNQVYFDFSGP